MLISLNLSNFSVLLGHPHRMRNLSERSRFFSLRNPSFYDIWSQPQSELFRTTVRTLLRTDLLKTSLSTFPSLNQAPIVGQLFRIFLERERLLSAYLTLKKKMLLPKHMLVLMIYKHICIQATEGIRSTTYYGTSMYLKHFSWLIDLLNSNYIFSPCIPIFALFYEIKSLKKYFGGKNTRENLQGEIQRPILGGAQRSVDRNKETELAPRISSQGLRLKRTQDNLISKSPVAAGENHDGRFFIIEYGTLTAL